MRLSDSALTVQSPFSSANTNQSSPIDFGVNQPNPNTNAGDLDPFVDTSKPFPWMWVGIGAGTLLVVWYFFLRKK
jgi:hypothetical protein